MSLVIIAPNRNVSEWINGIQHIDSTIPIEVWPAIEDKAAITGAIVWNHPQGSLQDFPNLKFISSMGAGVDHILKDPLLPSGVPVVRITDEALTHSMSTYLIMATLYYQRRVSKYWTDKENQIWDQAAQPELDISIGIMGMGVLGIDAALKLSSLGFKVCGYSNSRKNINGITSFAGTHELDSFLSHINVLICLLPLTSRTQNILNIDLFKKMNKGTYLINAARGNHLVEEDLLLALENEHLSGAFLDVYRQEPLPREHPFWKHAKIMMTPHIASITNPKAAIPQIIGNYYAALEEKPLQNIIDRSREY